MEIKNTMDTIISRRSYRGYKDEPITQEQYDYIMQAFDWAPTACNYQEIRAIVIQDKEMLSAFAADFNAYNAAKHGKSGSRSFHYDAPFFVILVGPRDFHYTLIDAGITVENMALAAEAVGLGSVIIGCLHEYLEDEVSAEWRKKFGFKENEMFGIGIAIGTPDSKMAPPERHQDKVSVIG